MLDVSVGEWAGRDVYRKAVREAERSCECDECGAATSPLAYLVDLLRCALDHLQLDETWVTLDTLAGAFFQPFGSVPDSCPSMSDKLRQARIAAEVLRRYLAAHPPSTDASVQLAAAEREYCLRAYNALLVQLGASDEELRISRDATEAARTALAERLGLDEPAAPGVHAPAMQVSLPLQNRPSSQSVFCAQVEQSGTAVRKGAKVTF